MKRIKTSSYVFVTIYLLIHFMYSCTILKQNDIACPDFKNDKQQTSVSLKNPVFFRFLKSDRSKKDHSKKDELVTDKVFIKTEIPDEFPTDYLAYKTFEVIAEKFVLSQHTSKGTQRINGVNLRPLNKDKVHNKKKEPTYFLNKTCDTIFLVDSTIILATEIVFDSHNFRFKNCDIESGEDGMIGKHLVKKIKYHDGTEKIFESKKSEKSADLNGKQKQEFFGILALVFFLLGLSYIPVVFPLSLILAIISLIRIKRNPGKFKDDKLARFVILFIIIVGSVAALLFLILIKSSFFVF